MILSELHLPYHDNNIYLFDTVFPGIFEKEFDHKSYTCSSNLPIAVEFDEKLVTSSQTAKYWPKGCCPSFRIRYTRILEYVFACFVSYIYLKEQKHIWQPEIIKQHKR